MRELIQYLRPGYLSTWEQATQQDREHVQRDADVEVIGLDGKIATENATRVISVASQRSLDLDDGAAAELTLAHGAPTTYEVDSLVSASITATRRPNQIAVRNDQSRAMRIASASMPNARRSTRLAAKATPPRHRRSAKPGRLPTVDRCSTDPTFPQRCIWGVRADSHPYP